MRFLLTAILLTGIIPQIAPAQDEYSFDMSEFEKKPCTFGGSVEFRPSLFKLDREAAFHKLMFHDRDEGDFLHESKINVELDASYEKGISRLYFNTNTDLKESYAGNSEETTLYEGYLSLRPSISATIDIGKRTLKWGKGYAWNPVAFVDRAKDPNDTQLPVEGYVVASADYIQSFDGALQTFSFTPVLIPVYEHVNEDFGGTNSINFAGKVYLLLCDTDIDLTWLIGESKTNRVGLDFSRSITTNFEIHGEYAFVNDFEKMLIDSSGRMFQEQYDAYSCLLGLRYLNTLDTTFILEYYHNDTGYSKQEMEDFYSFVDAGYDTWLTSGDRSLLQKASEDSQESYGRRNPMRDYLYLRIIQKEPFDILYFNPSLTFTYNLSDQSYSVLPELLYSPVTNLDLRLRVGLVNGGNNSEYGEKQNDARIEFRIEYFF